MVKKVVMALVLILALTACGGASGRTEGPKQPAEGGSFNWDAPNGTGLYLDVSDLSSVDSSLPFTAVEPG
jgi:hypothetical protein